MKRSAVKRSDSPGRPANHVSRFFPQIYRLICRQINGSALSARSLQCLSRVTSATILATLPIVLLWPYWRAALPDEVTQYLAPAIYEFPSEQMPRCEQFARHAEIASVRGSTACETNPEQMVV